MQQQKSFAIIMTAIATVLMGGAGSAQASCVSMTVNVLKMTDNGFVLEETVTVNDQLLVCDADHLPYQEMVSQMRQQGGWYGYQWTGEDDVLYRAVRPDVTRWTQGMKSFINPADSNSSPLQQFMS